MGTINDIRKALSERILILDGAMGTMLQKRGLQGDSELFNLTEPEAVKAIHESYIEAGADIIETNSFGANRISQSEYDRSSDAARMAETSAAIARQAADEASRKVWVAGSIGPTGKSLSLAQNISDPAFRPYSFDQMAEAYEEQIRALLKGGADLLLLETCFDALNTKAAIYALSRIQEAKDIELMISVSLSDRSGRTLTGQTMEAFYTSIKHAPLLSFGLNCSMGAKDLAPLIKEVSLWASCPVSCHPNAGLPDEMGDYDDSPEEMAAEIRKMAADGSVNIVGGCCGTTPAHIKAIAEAVEGLAPRKLPDEDNVLRISGLEMVAIDKAKNNFTNVGERTNVAGSRKFAKIIAAGDYESGLRVAADQIDNGASVIDINMDDAMLDSCAEMERFLRNVSNDPAVAKAAIMIDSSRWETILAGLKNAQGKCIVNSISLKEGEEAFLHKAREIKALGAAVIVIAFDEQGQATTYSRKIEICQRAYSLLTGVAGFKPSDVIFDVNVLPVGTGIPEHARYGVDFIEAVRWIKRNLPGALTSGGISNLSFAFRGNNTVREAMHSVFLYHAISAGLDMGIVNPAMLKVYDEIDPDLLECVEDVILDRDPGATERLIEKAQRALNEADKTDSESSGGRANGSGGNCANGSGGNCANGQGELNDRSAVTVEERLSQALVKGDSSHLEEDIKECLEKLGKAVDVIQGPLMAGMAKVGDLFGDGKMFLPQVVKSAKTMKNAVAALEPFMKEEEGGSAQRKPRIVMATVKGDVHDIGKNITSIVLSCNGFDILDLGVMVPKEVILKKASEYDAGIIGVSGLITPSLFQMEEICREMTARGLSTPLLVGGAAASALHTAVKLSPLYGHVYYGQDASSSAVLASRLISNREECEKEEHAKQSALRELYEKAGRKTSSSHSADPFPANTFLKGKFFNDLPARELTVSEVLPYFDWGLFFAIWGMKPGACVQEATSLEPDARKEIERLRKDAEREIDRLIDQKGCDIMISARFDACHSEGDDIVAKDFRLPMFRQNGGRSLADFIAPSQYGFDSPMGMFAISVHPKEDSFDCGCECNATEYGPMLSRAVRLTLAEAASGWLDEALKKELLTSPDGPTASSILTRSADSTGSAGSESPAGSPSAVGSAGSAAKIIKPAAGYSSCPDHTLKRDILRLLPNAKLLGIHLLDSCAMIPDASICGLIFIHPKATYPEIRRLSAAAIDAYALRRGLSPAEKSQFLGHLL